MATGLIAGALSRRNCPGPNFGASPPLARENGVEYPTLAIFLPQQVSPLPRHFH